MYMSSASKLFVFASVSLATTVVHAGSTLKDLESTLGSYKSLESNFSQTTIGTDANVLQTLTGVIKMQKPGQLRWAAEDPFPQLIVSDGKTIWQYDEDLEQVVIQDYQKQIETLNFLQLLEKPTLISAQFVLVPDANDKATVTNTENGNSYRLAAADPASPIKKVSFTFSGDTLTSASFTDSLKQVTHIAFTNMTLNKPIDKTEFKFEIPDGVDVIHQQ
ncbi:Outer-membrane lipoprotein carrier protein [BD1-7 clade bacterium]|uniref:Outer-membrane lipoprotein carrier protein n=1 Tax=BD1-7 clade bacterium TaxID=2029982 RepID=A0A5S9QL65_9GAMM|nr:Outer-membrane lipoprotein carrier protein [BD1-7 clade bacterium]